MVSLTGALTVGLTGARNPPLGSSGGGRYHSVAATPSSSPTMQLKEDSRVSSLLLMLEEILVRFSWILSEEILMDFTTCLLACLVRSQLRDLWTFCLKAVLLSLVEVDEVEEVLPGAGPAPVSSYLKLLTLSLLCLAG